MGAHSNLGVLSDAQAIEAAAASTNYIDLGVTTPQVGVGQHAPYLCIRTAVAPTEVADTISIELQTATEITFASPKVVMKIGGADTAELIVGTDARFSAAGAYVFRGQLPYECNERYMRLYYRNGTSTGIITLDAWLSDGPPSDFGNQVLFSNVGNP